MVAAYAAITGNTVNIADAYAAQGFDFSGTRQFDARTGYRSRSFLTVPMKNHEGEVIGVLQLINAIDTPGGQVVPFSPADQRLAESLASQAAVALSNRQLVAQLETLFESFIKLINLAIDEKSPYTGGHCQRVPELTMMLAEAAAATREGPLADFTLTDKDRYELRIAALLHDCGKVTTPVHVVDKATKLQTLFDRIHLIDTRFEVIRRDAEVRKWRSIAEGMVAEIADATYRDFCRQLEADREALRRANIGCEKMADADIEQVRQIAGRYRWTAPDGQQQAFLNADEVENLTIRSGTLTAAERDIRGGTPKAERDALRQSGLLSLITSRLAVNRDNVTSAIGYLLPAIVGRLTPGGSVPATVPPEVASLAAAGQSLLAAPSTAVAAAPAAGGGMMKWLPWVVVAAAALIGLSYCGKKTPAPDATVPCSSTTAITPIPIRYAPGSTCLPRRSGARCWSRCRS